MNFDRYGVEHSHRKVDFRVLRSVRGKEESVLKMACLIPQGYLVFD